MGHIGAVQHSSTKLDELFQWLCYHDSPINNIIIIIIIINCIGLSRYIAITNLSIIAVFVEYLRQFLIDLNQIYRHSSVPKNTSL